MENIFSGWAAASPLATNARMIITKSRVRYFKKGVLTALCRR
jgi:hypothetical protein